MAERLQDEHVCVSVAELISNRMVQTLEKKAEDDGESSGFKGPTIHKVPDGTRKGCNHAYVPALVSIGPLHRSNPSLRQLNHLKWKYLRELIDREPKMDLKAFVDAVLPLEKSARREYSVLIDLEPDRFVEMLVLDGCFLVIEYLIKRVLGSVGSPWAHAKWNLPMLWSDLLLLENQIPFFIVDVLFQVRYPNGLQPPLPNSTHSLCILDLALHFIKRKQSLEVVEEASKELGKHQIHHLLHLKYLCQLLNFDCCRARNSSPGCSSNRCRKIVSEQLVSVFYFLLSLVLMCKRPRRHSLQRSQTSEAPTWIPSATNLKEAGVKFKRRERTECYLNVSFSEDSGTLEIPFVSLQQSTVSTLRNLIAFEQCCPYIDSSRTYITAYAIFMDKIIDTPEDVAILVKHGIIQSKFGTYEDVAKIYNNICWGATLDYKEQYLVELFEQVNRYCDSDQHRWRASLVNIYFNNPWAAVSAIAALVLLLLTLGGTVASIVQTVYTVKDYKL